MRQRRPTLLLPVLALTIVSLLVAPLATLAASGLPATVTMYPEAAGAGATVEVTGLDFPGDATVALQLTTAAGTVPLASTTTTDGGHFRQIVSLPADAPEGAWELVVTGPAGATAVYGFEASPAAITAVPVEGAPEAATTAAASGNSPSDIAVLLVIAFVLGGIAIGGMFARRLVRDEPPQPGMGTGADLIWSGSAGGDAPEMTATDEPSWKAARSKP